MGANPRRDVRLLFVVDGYFSLGAQDRDDRSFSVSHLISVLKSTSWDNDMRIFVDTAHRDGDQNATIWGKFHFKKSIKDLNYYDEIWMFGYNGPNLNDLSNTDFSRVLDDDEILVLADFMQNGGGILADGDHDGLGSFMCGRIPRVKTMRKWFARKDESEYAKKALGDKFNDKSLRNWPAYGEDRADTLQPDKNNQYNFTNQSDDKPQPLTLVDSNGHDIPDNNDGAAHPLFNIGGKHPLKTFPDHFHEGEVLGKYGVEGTMPWSLTETFKTSDGTSHDEYPITEGNERELPRVIAKGKVIGGHTTLVETDKLCDSGFRPDPKETIAKQINILSVFDGRKVHVGRVLTDSSFHHFADLNLIGDPCAAEEKTLGFDHQFLRDMRQFYLNCVIWLANERVWAKNEDQLPAYIRALI